MADSKKFLGLYFSFDDPLRAQLVRTIIAYEASMRGLSRGQTVAELVKRAVDVESYPAEVRARLDEIAEDNRRRAIERSLAAGEERVA